MKVFDKRESKVVQTFDDIHKSNIFHLSNLRTPPEPSTMTDDLPTVEFNFHQSFNSQ